MSILNQMAANFGMAPRATVTRRRAFLPAAKVDRLTADWETSTLSADAILFNDLIVARNRSRRLKERNGYFQKFVWMAKTNVLGECGLLLKNMAKTPDRYTGNEVIPGKLEKVANKIIQDAFWEWGKKENCTVTRDMTWQEVNEVCLEATIVDGEPFVRKVRGFPNRFGFALQLIESDRVDVEMNRELPNGGMIRMGIEFDKWGATVAYHVRKRNPADNFNGIGSVGYTHERVPARDIVHPFLLRLMNQSRGFPWASPGMPSMNMLSAYGEAELVASREHANVHGFLESQGDAEYKGDPVDGVDPLGDQLTQSEPGTWRQLPQGLKANILQPTHPNQNFAAFNKQILRETACALATSYNILADDLESVNFSSARIGLMEPREVYKILQRFWGDDFCTPIFSDWLEVGLMNGAIPLPLGKFEQFNQPYWRGRRWPYIEPLKDVQAAILRINSGVSSLSKELADLNIERDEHLDEIADDMQAVKDRKLTLPEIFQAMIAKKPGQAAEEPQAA